MKNIILCDSKYDYKYQNIFGRISDVQVVEGKYFALFKRLVKQKLYYHIRYLEYRGAFLTLIRILLVYILSNFSGSKIIWTCHNIYEHSIPSKKANDLLRILISFVSYRIIVFHKDLIKFLPEFSHEKIIVASFGEYNSFIENRHIENPAFWEEYLAWLKQRDIMSPDIISISAAKRNNISLLVQMLQKSQLNTLIIAPKLKCDIESVADNFFIHSHDFVEKEVRDILTSGNIIGYIGHENISVPTSIYMYASYGIPIIGPDINPINTIINEYQIGEVISAEASIEELSRRIMREYSFYRKNCQTFLSENSWEKSAEAHARIFQ